MEKFDSMLSPVIDSTLGQRCSSIFGYQFSEIVRSLMSVYFCGGSCVEDVIRIKSFEILPAKAGSPDINIETGVKFKLSFWCQKPNAMLDVNMQITTLDDITVCQVGQILGKVGEKDSKKGIYTVEFELNPYSINAGQYKAVIWFGENQRYMVFSGFEQKFTVDNTLSDMGFNQSVLPGFLRPRNDFKITFEG